MLRKRAASSGRILPGDYDRLVIAHASGIAKLLGEQFDVLVVDEAQDSSPRDLAPMIEAPRVAGLSQVHFGDPGQAVMGFRGAVGDSADALGAATCGLTVLALTVNRRSSPEIVLASNSLQSAAGWSGPLALSHPSSPHGPEALIAVLDNEAVALDGLVVLLEASMMTSNRAAERHRLPDDLIVALCARGEAVAQRCDSGAPLVEIICPTNKIAEQLVCALEERGFEATWVRSAANPYDSMKSMLLRAYFDAAGVAVDQVQMVLSAHVNAWTAGADIASRSQIRACADVLFSGIGTLNRSASRQEVTQYVSNLALQINRHPNVGEAGRCYLERATLLVVAFSAAPYLERLDAAQSDLEQALFIGQQPLKWRRKTTNQPSLFEALKAAGIPPGEVPRFLDAQARRWRLKGTEGPVAGVVVKSPEMAKGDTCDAAVVYHAEGLPRRVHRSVLAANTVDAFAGPAQAYVPISRPRFVYVGLACGQLPPYHGAALQGWTYLDARSQPARSRRSA